MPCGRVMVLALSAGLLTGAAQEPSRPSASPLEFERTAVNLGPISDRDRRVEVFRFKNVTDRAVRLTVGGCHFCGIPTTDKPEYGAGESGVVIVDVDPSHRRGTMRAGGTVLVDGFEGYHQDVEVVAEVRPVVWIEPEQHTIHDHPRGVAVTVESRFNTRGDARVVLLEPNRPDLGARVGETTADVNPEDSADRFVRTPITMTLPATLGMGEHTGEVLVTTSDRASERHTITVVVRIVGEAVCTPDRMQIDPVEPGAVVIGEIRAESRYGAPLRVVDVAVRDRGLLSTPALDAWRAGADGAVVVRLVAVAPNRTIRWSEATISLTTVGPDGARETLDVPVVFSVRHRER